MARDVQMPSFDLTGKTAIITGGTKGLGLGIASTIAHSGANVVITARTAADCERVAKEITGKYCRGGLCIGVPGDSSKAEDIENVIAKTVENFGTLDILINNAGITGKTANVLSDDCDETNFEKTISVNLKGVFLFSRAAARQMVLQGGGGKIINISSVDALTGEVGSVALGASKAGVLSLTRTMALEFAGHNITVNAVCPGMFVTPQNETILEMDDIKSKMENKIPLSRLGTIEEIAGPVLAMASDCFGFMTGSYIVIDGGQTVGV